jgi:hypothetical protein
MIRHALPLIAICCLLTSWVGAADGPAGNAAVLYQRAFAALPGPDNLVNKIGASWTTAPLDAATLAALKEFDPAFALLHEGSMAKQCDWELDYSKGLDLKLPYLMPARTLTYAADLELRYLCAQKQYDRAADLAGDMLVLARRIASAQVIVARLTGSGIELSTMTAIAAFVPVLPKAALERLSGFASRPPQLPSLPDTVRSEGRMAVISFEENTKRNPPGPNVDPRAAARRAEEIAAKIRAASEQQAAAMSVPLAQLPAAAEKAMRLRDALLPEVSVVIPPAGGIIDFECRVAVQRLQFLAALAVAKSGIEELKHFPDPFGAGPFKYEKLPEGFLLRSALIQKDGPVTSEIGSSALK